METGHARLLHFGPHRRLRVWLNKLPFKIGSENGTVSRTFSSYGQDEPKLSAAAIEIFGPGAGPTYGMLGGHIAAAPPQEQLTTTISLSSGKVFEDALAGKFQLVHLGLVPDYIDGVFEAIESALMNHGLRSGHNINLNCCAYSLSSSSAFLFSSLSRWLVVLLSTCAVEVTDNELREIFPFHADQ